MTEELLGGVSIGGPVRVVLAFSPDDRSDVFIKKRVEDIEPHCDCERQQALPGLAGQLRERDLDLLGELDLSLPGLPPEWNASYLRRGGSSLLSLTTTTVWQGSG